VNGGARSVAADLRVAANERVRGRQALSKHLAEGAAEVVEEEFAERRVIGGDLGCAAGAGEQWRSGIVDVDFDDVITIVAEEG
jgi:hypothetical protein